jgi:hypothetical protein
MDPALPYLRSPGLGADEVIDLLADDEEALSPLISTLRPLSPDVIDLTGCPDSTSSVGKKRRRCNRNGRNKHTARVPGCSGIVHVGIQQFAEATSDLVQSATTPPAARKQAVLGSASTLDVPLAVQVQALDAILQGAAQNPNGPSWRENKLVERLQDFGIEAYGFEVPLGNGVCDCVAVDSRSRLCM